MAGGDRKNADSALVAALAGGSTVEAAAHLAGVSQSTAYRRLKDPGLQGSGSGGAGGDDRAGDRARAR